MWKKYLTAMLMAQDDGDGSQNGGGNAGGNDGAANAGADANAGGDNAGTGDKSKGQEGGDNAGGEDEKQFTQADIDRIVSERLARKEKADKEAAEKAAREAKMSAEEKAREKEREAEERVKAAETRAQMAEYRADLAGKVTRPDAALKLFDPEKHTTNGKADPAKFLKDNPEFAVKPADTSAGGAGGAYNRNTQEPDSWAAAVEADRKAGITPGSR